MATLTKDRYLELVSHGLVATHGCPQHSVTVLAEEYGDVIHACYSEGVASMDVIKLLYAAWKVFGIPQ